MAGFQGLFIPERSRRDWLLAAAVFSTAIVWHLPQFSFVQMNPDEGIVLAGADRILRGAVLYRDFFSFYTPGSYYWTALLFRIFGESIASARGALLVYSGLAAALTYMLARRVCGRCPALLASLGIVLVWSFRFLTLHNWDSTMLALAALYSAVWLLQSRRAFWAVTTGAFTAFSLLTEQSKGGGLLVGLAAALLVISSIDELGLRPREWLLLGAGFAIPISATFAYFAAEHSLAAMITGWIWPIRHYSAANKLPYGASIFLSDAAADFRAGGGLAYDVAILVINFAGVLICAVPLIVVLFGAIRMYAIRSGPAAVTDRYFVFCSSVAAGLLVATVITQRADLPHLIYLAPLFWFLVPAILDVNLPLSRLRVWQRPVAWSAIACLTIFSTAAEWPAITARHYVHTRRGTIRMQSEDEALCYVQRNLPQGAKLLVHPYHPLYSFLTATENPTRYEYLQPAMHTYQQFADAARQVATDQTPAVLLDLTFLGKVRANWPSTPAVSLADDPVTDFVLAHYHPCAILNPGNSSASTFVYLTRQGARCPARR